MATALCALAPMLVAWRQAGAPIAAVGSRSAGEGVSRSRLRLALIGTEVAVSLTLLTGSALMTVTALRMLAVDFGIDANVAMASLALRQQSYPDEIARAGFYERLVSQLESALPAGRGSIAVSDWWPMQPTRPWRVEGNDSAASADASVMSVTSGYFSTLGIPIREGRSIAPPDRVGAERVAVISASLARRLWPDGSAVGRQLRVQNLDGAYPSATASMLIHTVAGVVGDVRQGHADENRFDVYLSLLQNPGRFAYVFQPARTPALPVATIVASLDREAAVGTPRLMSELSIRSAPGRAFWPISSRRSPCSPACWRCSACTASSPMPSASASARLRCGWRSEPLTARSHGCSCAREDSSWRSGRWLDWPVPWGWAGCSPLNSTASAKATRA